MLLINVMAGLCALVTSWDLGLWKFNSAGQVLGERPDELQRMTPRGWRLGDGLMSHPVKKMSLLKPDTLFKIARRKVWRPYAQRSARRQGNVKVMK